MKSKSDITFLCRRMKELRERNELNQEEIGKKIGATKSTISRLEAGKLGDETSRIYAEKYCEALGMTDQRDIDQFLRGDRIAIPDTSALLYNTQLIDELSEEYNKVIVPKIVIDELDHIKDKSANALAKKAWQLICSIGNSEKTLQREYTGENQYENNDCKIISIAKDVANEFSCNVDIITNDADYSAYLKGVENITAIHLREYRATKQQLVNISRIKEIDKFYGDSYDDCPVPSAEEANAYFNNGYSDGVTLIISIIRNRSVPFEQRKAKIQWLIANGADINKRDCNNYYFPPLSHAAQLGDYDMFEFLLNECRANPNIGSLNPHGANKIRQKNEGNMPLMIVSFHTAKEWKNKSGYEKIVRLLCSDQRTSINQQDGNGFTALIKACANGNARCRDILIEAGADTKIVDLNGKDYKDHWNECLDLGPMKDRNRSQRGAKKW